jgi:hypothetical protein
MSTKSYEKIADLIIDAINRDPTKPPTREDIIAILVVVLGVSEPPARGLN